MSCFTVGSVGRHSNTHAYDGTDPVTPEMIGITGQRAKGTAVTLDGVIPDTALTEFVVHGKSAQAAVPSPDVSIPTGNNLFRGIGVPEDEEGYYYNTSDGVTATSDGFARFKFDNSQGTSNAFLNRFVAIPENTPFNAGEKYTLMVEFRNVVSAPTAVVPHSDNDFFDGSYTLTQFSVERVLIPVTARADISQASLLLRPYVLLYPGVSCDFEARISIYPADYDVAEYEPYQGGPVEIESAEVGSAWVCGKNLYPLDDIPLGVSNGVTLTRRGDVFYFTGTPTDSTAGFSWLLDTRDAKKVREIFPIPGKYTLSINKNISTVTTYAIVNFMVGSTQVANTSVGASALQTTITISSEHLNAENVRLRVGFYAANAASYPADGLICTVQLEPGERATLHDMPYVPAQTYPINLTLRGIPVDSGGNYTDENGQEWICDTYDAASGKYVQRIKELVLTGESAIRGYGANHFLCVIAEDALSQPNTVVSEIYCSHLNSTTPNEQYNTLQDSITVSDANNVIIALKKIGDTGGSLNEYKAFLDALNAAGDPMIVQYILAEPVVTHLPPEYIRAFSPVTNAAAGGVEIAVEYNNVAGSAYRPPSPVAVTLAAADWTGEAAPYSQTVTAAGAAVKAGSAVEIAESATDAQYTAALDAKLRRAAQSGADVTIKAYGTKPAIDIPILL